MELKNVLQGIDLFQGLEEQELAQVAAICTEKRFTAQEIIAREGEPGDALFIVTEGFVEVLLNHDPDRPDGEKRVVVNLGSGQVIGEMSLLDQGPRSATVRALSNPTVLQMIRRQDIERLCHENYHIGYVIMHNLAVDLSFKLRHRNLSQR